MGGATSASAEPMRAVPRVFVLTTPRNFLKIKAHNINKKRERLNGLAVVLKPSAACAEKTFFYSRIHIMFSKVDQLYAAIGCDR